jgi:hypothetical protein
MKISMAGFPITIWVFFTKSHSTPNTHLEVEKRLRLKMKS